MDKQLASEINEKMEINARKFAYLVQAYPEKTVPEIIGLLQMGPIDINCAIWVAVDLGYVTDMDKKTQHAEVLTARTEDWYFGLEVDHLMEELVYAFEKLNADEKDMEENYLSNWVGGYAVHDSLIAVKLLLDEGILHEYEIEDGENKYIFYTLKQNEGKNWGAKQFKVNPLTDEPNTIEPAEEATEE